MQNYFGNNLRFIRFERGLSLRDMAEFLDLNYETLRRYENGSREPTCKTAIMIAEKLGIAAANLIEKDLSEKKSRPEGGVVVIERFFTERKGKKKSRKVRVIRKRKEETICRG